MFCDRINTLKIFGLNLDLFRHPVIVHCERFKSIYDHSANFCTLLICGCMCCMLSIIIARSSAYALVVHVVDDVLN